jgi:hemolysin activation/secretion protein
VSYTGSRSSYVSTIAAPSGDPLQFRGLSDSDSLKFDRLVFRNLTTRESLSVGVTTKDSKNYLGGPKKARSCSGRDPIPIRHRTIE